MVAGGVVAGHIVNVAGYRFVAIGDRDRLQAVLRSLCTDLGLKGTVLLAPEGINFFLAGPQAAIEGFTAYLEQDERFRGIPLKEERDHLGGLGPHQPGRLHRSRD